MAKTIHSKLLEHIFPTEGQSWTEEKAIERMVMNNVLQNIEDPEVEGDVTDVIKELNLLRDEPDVEEESIMDKLSGYGMEAARYLPGGGGVPELVETLYNKGRTSMGCEPSYLPQNVETIQAKLMESSTGSIDSLIISDDEKAWDAWASKSQENFTKVQNIRMFPSKVIDGKVMYQIPIRNDDGSVDQGFRTMDIALQDYKRVFERTALSNP